MLIAQGQAELNSAAAVQKRCTLNDIRLRHCEVHLVNYEDDLTPPFSLNVSKPDTKAEVLPSRILRVTAKFQVESLDAADPRRHLFRADCSFDLNYSLESDYQPTEGEITAFKDGNAIFNCWPYVREFVQNLTMRMGSDAPPLPLLRIAPQPPSEPKKSAEKQVAATESVKAEP